MIFKLNLHPRIITVLIATLALVITGLFVTSNITANAQAVGELRDICNSGDANKSGDAANSPLCKDFKDAEAKNQSQNPVLDTLNVVVNLLSFAAGILAVIMVIFGGFKYVKSNGDSGKITEAKNTIVYGLVGIVVVVIARQLIVFVLNRLL